MNIKVKYNHPASPIKGIKLDKIYTFKKEGETYLEDGNEKIYLDIEKIKILFEPIDGSKWDDILKEKVKPIEYKKRNIEPKKEKKEVGE